MGRIIGGVVKYFDRLGAVYHGCNDCKTGEYDCINTQV